MEGIPRATVQGVEGERLVLLELEAKALRRAGGGKGLGLEDDGASRLWVLTTKAGMQQRLGTPEWLAGLGQAPEEGIQLGLSRAGAVLFSTSANKGSTMVLWL